MDIFAQKLTSSPLSTRDNNWCAIAPSTHRCSSICALVERRYPPLLCAQASSKGQNVSRHLFVLARVPYISVLRWTQEAQGLSSQHSAWADLIEGVGFVSIVFRYLCTGEPEVRARSDLRPIDVLSWMSQRIPAKKCYGMEATSCKSWYKQ